MAFNPYAISEVRFLLPPSWATEQIKAPSFSMSSPCAVIFCRTRGRGSRLADPPWSLLTSLSRHNPQRLLCCLGQNFDQHICRDSWISVWHLAGLCWTSNTGYESQTAPCKVRLTGLRAIKEACVVFKGQNFSFIPSSPPDTLSVYFSFCPKPSLFISHILEISFLSFILTVLFFHTVSLKRRARSGMNQTFTLIMFQPD